MKMYCTKCGAGTTYNMSKPKFCQDCGQSFSGVTEQKTVAKKKVIEKKKPVVEELAEEEIVEVPKNINKLEFDAIGTLQVKGTSIGNLVGTSDGSGFYKRSTSNGPSQTQEEFLEDFKKEAGASRSSTNG